MYFEDLSPVYSIDREGERVRLKLLFRQLLIGCSRPDRDIALTRAVDDHLGEHDLAARRVLDDDAFDRVALFDDIDDE